MSQLHVVPSWRRMYLRGKCGGDACFRDRGRCAPARSLPARFPFGGSCCPCGGAWAVLRRPSRAAPPAWACGSACVTVRAAPAAAVAVSTSATSSIPGHVVGRTVLVPRSVYPRYPCAERGGAGWEATILSATSRTAVVRYARATTAQGRPYEDVRIPLRLLQPL